MNDYLQIVEELHTINEIEIQGYIEDIHNDNVIKNERYYWQIMVACGRFHAQKTAATDEKDYNYKKEEWNFRYEKRNSIIFEYCKKKGAEIESKINDTTPPQKTFNFVFKEDAETIQLIIFAKREQYTKLMTDINELKIINSDKDLTSIASIIMDAKWIKNLSFDKWLTSFAKDFDREKPSYHQRHNLIQQNIFELKRNHIIFNQFETAK